MRIGIFGGTFDPPHVGHLIAAQAIHAALRLDRLLLIPAAVPPHKRDREVSPGPLRLEMTRAAVAGDGRFEVSDLELRRDGPSFTVDTLRELRSDHPDAELFLAIGADQLAELDTWHEPREIQRLATIAAFARSGQPIPERLPGDAGDPGDGGDPSGPRDPGDPARIRPVDVPSMHLSSTEIRRRVRAGEPIRYMVPEAVEAIIRREGLYL